MNIDELAEKAEANFHKHLVENSYPGRGIVIGCDPKGNPVLIYWIMGRSSNSRNRLFNLNPEGGLKTEAADSSLLEDPSLIIYNAVLPSKQGFLVTNGDHTDRILAKMRKGKTFLEAMHDEKHEPDPPNFTPRIAGLMTLEASELKIELALACKSSFSSELSEVHYHHIPYVKKGFGFCITTYMKDGDPLPHFQNNPLLMPIKTQSSDLADEFWNALDHENRVSLALLTTTGTFPASTEWEIRNARQKVD